MWPRSRDTAPDLRSDLRDPHRGRVGLAAASLLVLAVASVTPLPAVDTDLQFDRLGVEDGLAQSTVNAIVQDRTGFLWFGTADGLSRWDGYRFRTFRPGRDDTSSLAGGYVRALVVDDGGSLWVGTHRGISRFDDRTEVFTSYLEDVAVFALHVDGGGRLWAGTGTGLSRYDPAQDRFLAHAAIADGTEVKALAETEGGELLVGTVGAGLLAIDPDAATDAAGRRFDSAFGARIQTLHVDIVGQIWVGTDDQGLLRLEPDGSLERRYSHRADDRSSLADDRVHVVHEDVRGGLWVGTFSMLHRLRADGEGFQRFSHDPVDPHSIGLGEVLTLANDASGLLWVGTGPGGAARVHSDPDFKVWGPGVLGDELGLCVVTTDDGSVWVGTGDGLVRAGPGSVSVSRFLPVEGDSRSLSHRYVRTCVVSQSVLWVGTQDGLHRFDPETESFTRFGHDPDDDDSLVNPTVRELLPSADGSLWVGTHAGLNRLVLSPDLRFERRVAGRASELDSVYVSALVEDDEGYLWVGTHSGLFRLGRSGHLDHYVHDPEDPASLWHNIVTALLWTERGELWVGTNAGLSRAIDREGDGVRFEPVSEEVGLAPAAVSDLREDASGRLWISTFRGISRLDSTRTMARNFGPADGTLPDYAVTSATVGPDGTIYFGGLGGVTWFHPDEIVDDPIAPEVVVTDIRLGNRSLRPRRLDPESPLEAAAQLVDEVVLPPATRDLSLEFAGLHFAAPERNRYAYSLEGLHDDWIETDASRRLVGFATLRPGDYRLRIRAANPDGVWGEERRLTVTVLAPWWMTWWARSAGAVLAIALVVGLFRLRLHRLTQQREELRRLVSERTGELREKNEELRAAYAAVEEVSVTDPLTGLRNRRFLLGRIDDDVAMVVRRWTDWLDDPTRSRPDDADLVVFLMDLDHFKRVNDDFGHEAGDEVLRQTRSILESVFRDSDYCLRWGGEEFLILVRFVDRSDASDLAERLRSVVADHRFVLGAGSSVRLTCSVGFAALPFAPSRPDAVSWPAVVSVVDRCLYAAKNSSRDAWVGLEVTTLESSDPDDLVQTVRRDAAAAIANGQLVCHTSIEGPLRWS